MATTNSNSTTNQTQKTGQTSGSNTSTSGGSTSTTDSSTNGGSKSWGWGLTNTNTSTQGGSNSSTTGKSWASGTVSDTTQQNFNNANQEYTQSASVTQAYNNLQAALTGKPTFQSQYESKLADIYDQIMNRDKFSYNFNTDAMYQQYKDAYTTQGKQAMEDAMGQAAALTGGYGSSYSQTAGQQTYQNYLQQLNDLIPELRQQAYNEYQQEGEDLLNKYNITNSAYNNEYSQYRDDVSDWQADRSYNYNAYSDERNFDYNKYNTDRNYWQSEYWNERNAEQSNSSNTNSTNWSNSTSTSQSLNYNQSENWSNTHSTTNSSNWSNSATTGWNNSQTDSTSSTTNNSTTAGSGSGSSGSSSSSSTVPSDANVVNWSNTRTYGTQYSKAGLSQTASEAYLDGGSTGLNKYINYLKANGVYDEDKNTLYKIGDDELEEIIAQAKLIANQKRRS